ncbi:hypothetical protein JOD27_004221 [Lentzea nigeriaca]|nr:hypothetical protein [Lentzea nigeriaca]
MFLTPRVRNEEHPGGIPVPPLRGRPTPGKAELRPDRFSTLPSRLLSIKRPLATFRSRLQRWLVRGFGSFVSAQTRLARGAHVRGRAPGSPPTPHRREHGRRREQPFWGRPQEGHPSIEVVNPSHPRQALLGAAKGWRRGGTPRGGLVRWHLRSPGSCGATAVRRWWVIASRVRLSSPPSPPACFSPRHLEYGLTRVVLTPCSMRRLPARTRRARSRRPGRLP